MRTSIHRISGVLVAVATALVAAVAGGDEPAFDLSQYERLKPTLEPSFSSYGFQSAVRTTEALGTLAKANSRFGEEAATFGFAAQSTEARFFLVGASYSEALALVRSGNRAEASERLRAIEREAVNMGFPSALYNYIGKMRAMLERKEPYDTEVELEFLSLFQPFFEEYAKSQSEDQLTLFRAGSWLTDMGLAASAGDVSLLRQPRTLDYFAVEMKRMDAPKGVQDGLAEISQIARQDEISKRDADKVLRLVRKIQTLLG